MFSITFFMFKFSNWKFTECFGGADELIWLIIFNEPKVSWDHQFLKSNAAAPIKECNLWLCQEIWQSGLHCFSGHYWKQETEKEKEWQRKRKRQREVALD